ncbi:MAG: hypothetical protein C0478_01960 [Planctomyces sp.]|nr:hypothetical protein [Planctomyces sp.]
MIAGGLAFTLLLATTPSLVACPFCSAPSKTLTEQVTDASALLEVHWESAKDAQGTDVGSTTYRIQKVIKQAKDQFAVDDLITLPRYRPGTKTEMYLLFGNAAGNDLDWQPPVAASRTLIDYLQNAPKPDRPSSERLPYFMGYLEHAETPVSDDAYAEFANAPYEEISPLSSKMPREKLRQWLVDPKVSASRMGLYGLMMGLSGNEEDRVLMEKKILEPNTDFRLGIDGVMGGYLLLAKEQGLEVLEKQKLADKQAPFSETYAAMQALRFMWQYGNGAIPHQRLRKSMEILLERPELADLVIADLARWKDWEIVPLLATKFDDPDFGIPSIKRAIVRFMIYCVKDAQELKSKPPGETGLTPEELAIVQERAQQAEAWLKKLEETDPNLLRDAKRFLLIK